MRISAILLASLLISHSLGADLIVPQTAAPRILVPAAGNAAGANGTYFRSDIQVVNLRNAEQRVQMFWLPQGSSGAAIAPHSVDISPLSGIGSEDFVASVLTQSGVGSIELVGVTETGQFDQNARLHVTSRIWTPRPDGGSGTMSQTFPALIMPGSTARVKTAFGLRRSSQYRVNVGITNPSDSELRFRVTAFSFTEVGPENPLFEVTVQPRSIEQRVVNGLIGDGTVQVLIENLTEGAATAWEAWASSVDNESGDAWSQIAFPASQ
jgi:hypothetical protein